MSNERIKTITDDERTIKRIVFSDDSFISVGSDDWTSIKPYEEPGEMTHVTWLACFKGSSIVGRVKASRVGIYYD